MVKGLVLGSLLMIGTVASPAFAEATGGAAGSVEAGASSSSGDALVIAGSAIVAAGIIGGVVALVSDNGHGSSSTATSPSTATATSTSQ